MKPFLFKFLVVWLALVNLTRPSFAGFIVVPNEGVRTEALEPFALTRLGITSARYQQVYDASAFQGAYTNSISELLWGGTGSEGPFSGFLPDVEIALGVTSRAVEQISTTFDENITSSLTPVFRDRLILREGQNRILFSTPFTYDTEAGNLLLQIRVFAPEGSPGDLIGPMGATTAAPGRPDLVSRLFAPDVNALTGTADSIGLTTTFIVTIVPEPSTVVLTISGFALLWCWHWKKKHRP